MTKAAIISDCGLYRYSLTRIWNDQKPMMLFIMLNPSKADANKDDATIRRCIGFANSWGFGGFMVGNLFAFRSTDPKELFNAVDPIGSENALHVFQMITQCNTVVCAWGNAPILKKLKPLKITGKLLFCIKLSKDGVPVHPLFLPKGLPLIPYNAI